MLAIIIVNFNGYVDTLECVQSILKSTYQDYRIILVDNGSDDADLITKDYFLHRNCEIILSAENMGFSGGNNIGIRYAEEKFHPDFYLLLNNDTIVEPNTLEALIASYGRVENCGIITGRILYYYNKDVIWSAGGKFDFKTGIADQPDMGKKNTEQYDRIGETTFCTGCVMLIPSDVIKDVGLLEESYFLYAEDTDFCCRVMEAGYKLYYSGAAIIYHKVSASTGRMSKISQYYNVRNNFYIIKKYCNRPLIGYMKRWYRIIKSIKRKEMSAGNVLNGYKDFVHGITGRKEF